jgi:hypothetical protein
MTTLLNVGGLPIPQDVPVPKQELKDIGGAELEAAGTSAEAANFLARLMGQHKDVKRSNIIADPDTIRVTRLHGRLTFRHLHPQDPPTIMIPDPEARGGYLCAFCGDEADSATATILAQDVKIEESATAYYEAEEKEYQETPVLVIGSKVTEFKLTLKFGCQTTEAIKECLGKLAGAGHKIVGYAVTEKDLELEGAVIGGVAPKIQEVAVYFEDMNAAYRFRQDKKIGKIHKRFAESEAFKKAVAREGTA